MIYEKTEEQFDATILNLVFTLSQLTGQVPTAETIEACKAEAKNWGKIRIVQEA